MRAHEHPKTPHAYVRALRFDPLTTIYDPLMRWCLRERTFKTRLIEQAGFQAGQRVLDVGCGTGTLDLWILQCHPGVAIVGLDGDAHILRLAREKAARAGLTVTWRQGFSYQLPFPDASFDRVVSSLVFHHLTLADKVRTLAEIWRVLTPGGQLHFADWGQPRNGLMQLAFLSVRMLDGFAPTAANAHGQLPHLLRQAGFGEVSVRVSFTTLLGTLSLFSAVKRP